MHRNLPPITATQYLIACSAATTMRQAFAERSAHLPHQSGLFVASPDPVAYWRWSTSAVQSPISNRTLAPSRHRAHGAEIQASGAAAATGARGGYSATLSLATNIVGSRGTLGISHRRRPIPDDFIRRREGRLPAVVDDGSENYDAWPRPTAGVPAVARCATAGDVPK